MLKRKKLATLIIALMLSLAFTVPAFATSFLTCYLDIGDSQATTSQLTTTKVYCGGYNSSYSSDKMYVKLQIYTGVTGNPWSTLSTGVVPIDYWSYRAGPFSNTQAKTYRTKITPVSTTAFQVEGGGTLSDY